MNTKLSQILALLTLVASTQAMATTSYFECPAEATNELGTAVQINVTGAVHDNTGVLHPPVLVLVDGRLVSEYQNPSYYLNSQSGYTQLSARRDGREGGSLDLLFTAAEPEGNFLRVSTYEHVYTVTSFTCSYSRPTAGVMELK